MDSISITKSKEGHGSGSIRQLASISFLKPFSCIGVLYLCSSVSGYGAIMAYSNDYFDNVGARAMSADADSVILGLVKCTFTFLAPFILFKLQKKRLYVTCGFISSIAFILGIYIVNLIPSSMFMFSIIVSPIYHLIFLLLFCSGNMQQIKGSSRREPI